VEIFASGCTIPQFALISDVACDFAKVSTLQSAVQHMRALAEANDKLKSSAQDSDHGEPERPAGDRDSSSGKRPRQRATEVINRQALIDELHESLLDRGVREARSLH
jgi:hypothetical protein